MYNEKVNIIFTNSDHNLLEIPFILSSVIKMPQYKRYHEIDTHEYTDTDEKCNHSLYYNGTRIGKR